MQGQQITLVVQDNVVQQRGNADNHNVGKNDLV